MPKFEQGRSGNPSGSSRKARDRSQPPQEPATPPGPVERPPDPRPLSERILSFLEAGMSDVAVDMAVRTRQARLLGESIGLWKGTGEEKLDLETIALRMQAEHEKIDRERDLVKRGEAAGLPANFEFGPDGRQLDEHAMRLKVEEAEQHKPPLPNGLKDSEWIAAQRVEEERQRRARIKYRKSEVGPAAQPVKSMTEAESELDRAERDKAETERQVIAARLIQWPGMTIDPFGGT